MAFYRSTVLVSVDPICVEKGAYELIDSLQDELIKQGLLDEVQVLETPRLGDPEKLGPDIVVYPEGTHYTNITYFDVPRLVEEHFIKGRVLKQYAAKMADAIDEELSAPKSKEIRVVLRNIGEIDPRNIEDYFAKENMTLFMVTHDRFFLERVCNEIIELDNGKLYQYKGNYSYYLEKKELRVASENASIDKAQNLFVKELDWMRR